MALSRELSIKNQHCISTSMVLFYKFLAATEFEISVKQSTLTSKKYFSEIYGKNNNLNFDPQVYNQQIYFDIKENDLSNKNVLSKSKSNCCCNLFKDIEVTYLAAFFLSSKVCNCLTPVSRIAMYFFNQLIYNNKEVIEKVDCDCLIKFYEDNKIILKDIFGENIISKNRNNNKANNNFPIKNQNGGGSRSRKNSRDFAYNNKKNNNNIQNSKFNPINQNTNQSNMTNIIKLGGVNSFSLNFINQTNQNNNYNKRKDGCDDLELCLKETLDTSEFSNKHKLEEDITIEDFSLELKCEILRRILENKIKEKELEILMQIGFDLNVDLPYLYMDRMRGYFQQNFQKSDKLIEICYNFLNDSFKLPLCVYYSPLKIALASILLLSRHFKNIELVDNKNGVKWYQMISEEIELEEIENISDYLNVLYTSSEISSSCYGGEGKKGTFCSTAKNSTITQNSSKNLLRIGDVQRAFKEVVNYLIFSTVAMPKEMENEREFFYEKENKIIINFTSSKVNDDFTKFSFLGKKKEFVDAKIIEEYDGLKNENGGREGESLNKKVTNVRENLDEVIFGEQSEGNNNFLNQCSSLSVKQMVIPENKKIKIEEVKNSNSILLSPLQQNNHLFNNKSINNFSFSKEISTLREEKDSFSIINPNTISNKNEIQNKESSNNIFILII